MRITTTLMLIICYALAVSIISVLHVGFNTSGYAYSNQLANNINASAQQSYNSVNVASGGGIALGFGDFIFALEQFVSTFFQALIVPYSIFVSFGVPQDMAYYMSFPIYILYFIALIQFISGRYIE